ncbi:DUF421 domain-containing protein [Janibacter sp. GS2]|uniref:DUF421 domain-containing protein n=1 Tax=Janibacter sp. GS2 TaxID=3442646 RepID=UPI003EBF0319
MHWFDQITLSDAVTVIVATTGMYLAFLVMVRLFGARVLGRMSTFDHVVTLMMGAIAGRVVLGHTPVMAAGVLGLLTLLVLEVGAGQLRTLRWGARVVTPPPVVLLEAGLLRPEAMLRAHVTEPEVLTALRLAGVRSFAEVAFAIFEPTGQISVLRAGARTDPRILADIPEMSEPGSSGP